MLRHAAVFERAAADALTAALLPPDVR
jgi:hypothetical protein